MADDNSFLGTGWSFPPAFSNGHYQLISSFGLDNINQSIDLIFKTTMGNRPLAPEFGSNLSSYTFRRIDAGIREEIIQNLSLALLNNEPRIGVERIETILSTDGSLLSLKVFYVVHQTNTRHNHVHPFSTLEATNLTVGS